MLNSQRTREWAAVLLAAAMTVGCAGNPGPAGSDALMSPELVPVKSGLLDWGPDGSVLDLVSGHLSTATLAGKGPQPLVLIDGMVIGQGLNFLGHVPAALTTGVRYMRPLEAVRLYGRQASAGAILVRLKSGG